MKIKVNETFSHETGCFVFGREYTVSDEFGAEVVAAKIAEEIKVEPKKPAKASEPAKAD